MGVARLPEITGTQFRRTPRKMSSSAQSTKLGTADLGTTWKVLGRSGNWVMVDYYGETGFIYKKYTVIG